MTTPEASIWLCELLQKYTCSPQVLGDVGAPSEGEEAVGLSREAKRPTRALSRGFGGELQAKWLDVVPFSPELPFHLETVS